MLSSLLLAVALGTTFFIQTTASAISGAWFFFFMAAMFTVMLKSMPLQLKAFDWIILAWLVLSGSHVFFLKPIMGGFSLWCVTCVMPIYYLAVLQRHDVMTSHIRWCGAALLALAVNCWIQYMFIEPIYPQFHGRVSWPLLNPNNMGTLMMIGFVAMAGLFVNRPSWGAAIFSGVFGFALLTTGSKAAILAAGACIGVLLLFKFKWKALYAAPLGLIVLPFAEWWKLFISFQERIPMWESTLKIIQFEPWRGVGVGTFPFYYDQVRTEETSAGMFAHNDFLQYAAEMGIPLAVFFASIWVTFFALTRKENIIPAVVVMGIILHSMISFPLYVPAVNILLALAVCYWRQKSATIR